MKNMIIESRCIIKNKTDIFLRYTYFKNFICYFFMHLYQLHYSRAPPKVKIYFDFRRKANEKSQEEKR